MSSPSGECRQILTRRHSTVHPKAAKFIRCINIPLYTSLNRSSNCLYPKAYFVTFSSNAPVKLFHFMEYRKIPNISPGLIEVHKHFLGGLIFGGLIFGGLIFGGHFVLVSEYQDLKIHCYIHRTSLL